MTKLSIFLIYTIFMNFKKFQVSSATKAEKARTPPSNFQMNDSPAYSSDQSRFIEFDTKSPGKKQNERKIFQKQIFKNSVISKLSAVRTLATGFSAWGAVLTDECPQGPV